MRRPVIFTLWRVLIGLVLVVGFPFAVSGQKYVETLEYLRMSIDASGLAYDKLEETEAYVVSTVFERCQWPKREVSTSLCLRSL